MRNDSNQNSKIYKETVSHIMNQNQSESTVYILQTKTLVLSFDMQELQHSYNSRYLIIDKSLRTLISQALE